MFAAGWKQDLFNPKRKNRPNATGRNPNPTDRFVRLSHTLLETAAYRSLNPNARALLIELTMMENNSNNGSLWLSVDDAAARMGVADHKTASAAFRDLQEAGFIEMTQDAFFRVKASGTSRARTWRLTWRPVPMRSAPTHEYLEFEPAPKTRARKRMEAGLRALKRWRRRHVANRNAVEDFTMLSPILSSGESMAVEESTTVNPANEALPPESIIEDSTLHTAGTIGTVRQMTIKPVEARGESLCAARSFRP